MLKFKGFGVSVVDVVTPVDDVVTIVNTSETGIVPINDVEI